MKPASKPPALRREPLQARSRERVRAIVEAAAIEFAQAGFEGATTEAIAARAQVPIGSVYQFFANKSALFDAVAELGMERARAMYEERVLPEVGRATWLELLEISIDAFYAHHREDTAFRAVAGNMGAHGLYVDRWKPLERFFVESTLGIVAANAPHLPSSQHATIAFVVVQTITSMLFAAYFAKPTEAPLLVHETKVMLRRYLEGYELEGRQRAPGASASAKPRRNAKRPA